MELGRSSGILLHPTSLPGRFGIGDLGREAHAFVDRLADAGQSWWQVLPLNPTDASGSPYASYSAFASNPLLIAIDPLIARGWLTEDDVAQLVDFALSEPDDRVDFSQLAQLKMQVLRLAFQRHDAQAEVKAYEEKHSDWLEDVALFRSFKAVDPRSWRDWDPGIVRRDNFALANAITKAEPGNAQLMAQELHFTAFAQWLFEEQWRELKAYANGKGVRLIGDLPIFVAMDSADVWANREWFEVGQDGTAQDVAGVPPDYFSATGQKWGNPLYNWPALEADGFRWWIRRVQRALDLCDLVRIDHFRGFESYWAVPEEAPNAIIGEWRNGPGDALFKAIHDALGAVPFIAEDLGIITDAVVALRDRNNLPGMKILQFAFDGNPNHPFLPHTYPERCVAYTGTHDNDTSRGWYESLPEHEKHRVRSYLRHGDEGIVAAMMESVAASKAELVVFPLQDVLDLDADARMNIPGSSTGNWGWRATAAQLNDDAAFQRLADITHRTDRT
ncbi:MAG: 4-alpha-glucanotransferase [bacterium]